MFCEQVAGVLLSFHKTWGRLNCCIIKFKNLIINLWLSIFPISFNWWQYLKKNHSYIHPREIWSNAVQLCILRKSAKSKKRESMVFDPPPLTLTMYIWSSYSEFSWNEKWLCQSDLYWSLKQEAGPAWQDNFDKY